MESSGRSSESSVESSGRQSRELARERATNHQAKAANQPESEKRRKSNGPKYKIYNFVPNTHRRCRCIVLYYLYFIHWWQWQFTINMICIAYIFYIFAFLHIGVDWYFVLTWTSTNFSWRGWCRCFSMFWRRVLWFIYAWWVGETSHKRLWPIFT